MAALAVALALLHGLPHLTAGALQPAAAAEATAPRGLMDLGVMCDVATHPATGQLADFVFGEALTKTAALAAGAATDGIGAEPASFAMKLLGQVAKVGITEFVLPSVCDQHMKTSTQRKQAGEEVVNKYAEVTSDIGLRRGGGTFFTQTQLERGSVGCTKYPERATFCSAIGHEHAVPSTFSNALFVDMREAQVEAAFAKMQSQATMAKVMGKHALCKMAVMDAICLEGFPLCDASTLTPCVMACRNIKECFLEAFPNSDDGSLDTVVHTCQAQCKASIEESLSSSRASTQTVALPTSAGTQTAALPASTGTQAAALPTSRASESSPAPAPTFGGFHIGDLVMVRRGVMRPHYGWGNAKPTSAGRITAIHDDGTIRVDFHEQPGWVGRAVEMEHAFELCSATNFSSWLKVADASILQDHLFHIMHDGRCICRNAVNRQTDDIPHDEWVRREDSACEITERDCRAATKDEEWLQTWVWIQPCRALMLMDFKGVDFTCLVAWGIGKAVYMGNCPKPEDQHRNGFWWPHINGTIESYASPGNCLQSTTHGGTPGSYILAPCSEGTALTTVGGVGFDAASKFSLGGGVMLGTAALSGHATAGLVLVLFLLLALACVAAVPRARRVVAVEPAGMAQATRELLSTQDIGEAAAPEDACA